MKIVQGTYTTAQIMTDDVEQYAIAQVKALCDNPVFKDSKVVCMPDIHPGKVTPIGFTAILNNYPVNGIMPSLIGNDIGCGILAIKLEETRFESQKLDRIIRENIPSGFSHRLDTKLYNKYVGELYLYCKDCICHNYNCISSFGTLGGGNHFIEIDKDPDDDSLWLIIHSGSRGFGSVVNKYYLDKAHELNPEIPYELGVLHSDLADMYFNDYYDLSDLADSNRSAIADIICNKMKFHSSIILDVPHNTIDLISPSGMIIRKGAISARTGKDVVIPINSKDGVIIGKGKGNHDWNYSAPHGSGRIMNRTEVANQHTLSEYKKEMNGIYSPSINKNTLDEAPFAYRSIDQILPLIQDTVEVTKILKPVYNFKGGKE